MTYKKFLKNLTKQNAKVLFNEPIKNHTSFGIGGVAKYFVVVHNTKTLVSVLKKTKKFFILGAGTNILFQDKKYNGTVIKLGNQFKKIKVSKNAVTVGAGVNLFVLNKFLKENQLSGLEFTYGIPGTVGGALISNAGAFGGEIGNFVKKVKIFNKKRVFWTKKFNFSYRNSSFKDNCQLILAVTFKLEKGKKEEIENLQKLYFQKRIETQPYGQKSAGSVFKRIIKENS